MFAAKNAIVATRLALLNNRRILSNKVLLGVPSLLVYNFWRPFCWYLRSLVYGHSNNSKSAANVTGMVSNCSAS